MKYIFILLLITGNIHSQTPISFTKIDTLDLPKDKIYIKVLSFVAEYFKSSKDVIQLSDKENGQIIIKGEILTPTTSPLGIYLQDDPVSYTVRIDIRDNKYRIIMDGFYHQGTYNKRTMNGTPTFGIMTDVKPKGMLYKRSQYNTIIELIQKEQINIFNSLSKAIREDKAEDF